jgi:mRNA-degrading endonuclease RelE of RelBE toxin-antitoxin system
MKLRTVAILILMACVVVATSAFGTYQDSIGNDDDDAKKVAKTAAKKAKAAAAPAKDVVGASGAGTSYKQSNSHLDISEKTDGPYVKDGTNTYRGKAGGYDLRDTYDSDDERADGGGDSDSDDDEPKSEFQRKLKYISKMFKEIFSKWKSQETIMAPTSIEEDPDNPLGPEGFKLREKFKKGARQGMRKLKNAFRGRFK